MQIRQITSAHQIVEVIHAAFKRYETDPMPSSALFETAEQIELEMKKGLFILGTYVDEMLVGVVKVKNNSDHFYFSRLAVLPSNQGKGIASALVDTVEQLAAKQSIAHVTCKVRKTETDNIRLYTKLGYSMTTEEMTISPLGFEMATVTMEKQVL